MNNVLRLWKSNIIIKWQTNMKIIGIQLELIIFSLIRFLFKKVIKLNFFFKKNRNRTETSSNQPVSVQFF
jgi:hypothetical protein